jgi:hypothetical protein
MLLSAELRETSEVARLQCTDELVRYFVKFCTDRAGEGVVSIARTFRFDQHWDTVRLNKIYDHLDVWNDVTTRVVARMADKGVTMRFVGNRFRDSQAIIHVNIELDWSTDANSEPLRSNLRGKCAVCHDEENWVVSLVPCGHTLCTGCAPLFVSKQCPLRCGSLVQRVQNLFFNPPMEARDSQTCKRARS